ncbi:GlsB/YeaQ/YmgE family stress response membrane protein [Candidatus Sumerlaeota bacterium]|nr:GlsB/YeaQ/YmgE family stress response membrane protein [Candidatus Sumerlaeota bacterium]
MELIYYLIIGGVAGFLAGQILKGRGFGLIGNIIVGIIGGVVGGWLFSLLQLESTGLIGNLIVALVGAVVLIYVVNLAMGKRGA